MSRVQPTEGGVQFVFSVPGVQQGSDIDVEVLTPVAGGACLEVRLPGMPAPVSMELPPELDPGTCRVKLKRKSGELVVTLLNRVALLQAVDTGNAAKVELLLWAGASPEGGGDAGEEPPLCRAAALGASDVIAALLRAGAGLEARTSEEENAGQTPLHVACWNVQAAAVKQLLDAGADVNAGDEDAETPLMVAARLGSLPIVDTLLAAGADSRRRDDNGWLAVGKAAVRSHGEVANRLLQLLGDDLQEGDLGGLPVPAQQGR
eukprot:jgi/Tetstr1/459763/TSEL_005116.t1